MIASLAPSGPDKTLDIPWINMQLSQHETSQILPNIWNTLPQVLHLYKNSSIFKKKMKQTYYSEYRWIDLPNLFAPLQFLIISYMLLYFFVFILYLSLYFVFIAVFCDISNSYMLNNINNINYNIRGTFYTKPPWAFPLFSHFILNYCNNWPFLGMYIYLYVYCISCVFYGNEINKRTWTWTWIVKDRLSCSNFPQMETSCISSLSLSLCLSALYVHFTVYTSLCLSHTLPPPPHSLPPSLPPSFPSSLLPSLPSSVIPPDLSHL